MESERRTSPKLSFQVTILLYFSLQVYGSLPELGILSSRVNVSSQESEKYCIIFYKQLSDLATDEEHAQFLPVSDALNWNICDDSEPPPSLDLDKRLVFVNSEDNCSDIERAARVQSHGGAGILIVEEKFPTPELNGSGFNFTFAYIENSSYTKIFESQEDVSVGLYSPEDSPFHFSLIIIWFLAVFSIAVGAYWSGKVRHKLYMNEQCLTEDEGTGNAAREPVLPHEESSMSLSIKSILAFVALMCVMLLCLYYLYPYLVYLIMGMFCLASGFGVFCCLEPLVSKIPCGNCRTPYFNIYIIRGTLELRQILLLLFSFGLSILWLVMRKEPWAWILQDILGIAFSVNVLKVIRLPNLKICTFLLCGLVLYDVFFVFITPLLTSNNKSIMVEVAKGAASTEQLPMVMKVPNFVYYELAEVCNKQDNYNLLGFGDILIPGLLVAYVHSFDLKVGTPCHLYYLINVIGYGTGLVVTFVALWLMNDAQPALLYLVPFTLVPTFITALIRGEVSAMWHGDSDKQPLLRKLC